MIAQLENRAAARMAYRSMVSLVNEIMDIASALAFSLSYLIYLLCKILNDKIGSFRKNRGYDSNYDQTLSIERVYRMAMEVMKAHQSKYDVYDVWNVFETLSKRQAYKILDEIHYLRKECGLK